MKTRDGRDVTLVLPDNVAVGVATAVRFEDIKDGDFVGTTTKTGPGGAEVATEVHYLAPTTQAGQSAWDGQPNSKMTNANVAGKVAAKGDSPNLSAFSVPSTANFTFAAFKMRTKALVILRARSSNEPAQPTQNSTSGVSPLASISAMVGTRIGSLLDMSINGS